MQNLFFSAKAWIGDGSVYELGIQTGSTGETKLQDGAEVIMQILKSQEKYDFVIYIDGQNIGTVLSVTGSFKLLVGVTNKAVVTLDETSVSMSSTKVVSSKNASSNLIICTPVTLFFLLSLLLVLQVH